MPEAIDPTAGAPTVLLDEAVRVLTAAARLANPGRTAAGNDDGPGSLDWAEFVTLALAGAAANVGGIEVALVGRTGSWEADAVRQLLVSTLGDDEETLLRHRTEPVTIDLYVDEIMVDTGVWAAYDDASSELYRRQAAWSDIEQQLLTEEEHREADAVDDLLERLETQRASDWAAYGEALRYQVEAAAARLPGLQVPVIVAVDLDTFRPDADRGRMLEFVTVEDDLMDDALGATPLPGKGQAPLQRLEHPLNE